jgi:hypothetical protein
LISSTEKGAREAIIDFRYFISSSSEAKNIYDSRIVEWMCENSLKLQIETMGNILHILYSEHKAKTKVIVSMIVQIRGKV